jgi:hypothetical protein
VSAARSRKGAAARPRKPAAARPARGAPRRQPGAPVEAPPSFAPVAAAFSRDREVTLEKGWGAGNVVLKVNGKIFAMLQRADLVAKVPKERAAELVAAGKGALFDPRRDGRLMKEWIVVPPGGESWIALAREAHAFVRTGAR